MLLKLPRIIHNDHGSVAKNVRLHTKYTHTHTQIEHTHIYKNAQENRNINKPKKTRFDLLT